MTSDLSSAWANLTSPEFVRAVLSVPIPAAYVATLTLLLAVRARRRTAGIDFAVVVTVAYGASLVFFAFLVLLVAEVGAAYSWLYLALFGLLSVGQGALLVPHRRQLGNALRRLTRLLISPGERWWIVLTAVVLLMIGIGCARKPMAVDEVQYHWVSAVLWARHHGVVRSPYKFTNGPALIEAAFIFPAVLRTSTLAHWYNASFVVLLCLSAATLARHMRARPGPAAAAVLGIPGLLGLAAIAETDIPLAALLATVLVVIAAGYRARWSPWVVGLLLAAAYSVKSLLGVVEGVPLVVLMIGWQFRQAEQRGRDDRERLLEAARFVSLAAVLPAAVALLWMAHTWRLIGHPFASSAGFSIVHTTSGLLKSGQATGRWPSITDVVLLPLAPFTNAVLGQREPFGGRSGYLPLVVPVLVASWFVWRGRASSITRQAARNLVALVAALIVFNVIVGAVFPKTRFLLVAYVLISASVLECIDLLGDVVPRSARRLLTATAAALLVTGVLDGSRTLLRPHV